MLRIRILTKWRKTFAAKKNKYEVWYDIFDDYDAIEASFAQQYGIRLRTEDEMLWDEFTTLLAGLNGDTPLGYLVRIRSEKDPKVKKKFTKAEKKIYNEWRFRHSPKPMKMSREEVDRQLRKLFGMK